MSLLRPWGDDIPGWGTLRSAYLGCFLQLHLRLEQFDSLGPASSSGRVGAAQEVIVIIIKRHGAAARMITLETEMLFHNKNPNASNVVKRLLPPYNSTIK